MVHFSRAYSDAETSDQAAIRHGVRPPSCNQSAAARQNSSAGFKWRFSQWSSPPGGFAGCLQSNNWSHGLVTVITAGDIWYCVSAPSSGQMGLTTKPSHILFRWDLLSLTTVYCLRYYAIILITSAKEAMFCRRLSVYLLVKWLEKFWMYHSGIFTVCPYSDWLEIIPFLWKSVLWLPHKNS